MRIIRRINTKHKIAFMFSVLAGVLVLVSTFATFYIVRSELRLRQMETLRQAIVDAGQEYQDGVLEDRAANFQKEVSKDSSSMLNIYDLDYRASKVTPSAGRVDEQKLKDSKAVYSRLINQNGDVEFTSDLFETYLISTESEGYQEYNFGQVCVRALTSRTSSGEVLQVAVFCSISAQDVRDISVAIILGSILVLLVTYPAGLLLAWILIRPLEQAANATKKFIQDVNHELLTPLSVVQSTIEANLTTRSYQQGLEEAGGEIKEAQEILATLVNKYVIAGERAGEIVKINIREVVEKVWSSLRPLASENGQELIIDGDLEVKSDPTAVRLIMRNLIENAVKHSPKGSQVKVSLKKNKIEIENKLEYDLPKNILGRGVKSELSSGNGVGLSVAQDLSNKLGWKMEIVQDGEEVVVRLKL